MKNVLKALAGLWRPECHKRGKVKNTFNIFGIIAIVVMMGFSMTACDSLLEERGETSVGQHGIIFMRIGETYEVSGVSAENRPLTGALAIPATHNGLPVTAIRRRALERNQLTSVTIPNSVTAIRDDAFLGNHLVSASIPNSVTTIGAGAFMGNQLASLHIPNSVTVIDAMAFQMNQLTSITIPNSVTTILADAFLGNRLTSVHIPSSVTVIGMGAFRMNPLTSVRVPEAAILGAGAFDNGVEIIRF